MTFFFSNRTDGLGERLKALLNAMVLAEHYKLPFKFCWPEHKDYVLQSGHPDISASSIFSKTFLDMHLIDRDDLKAFRVRPLRSLGASIEADIAIQVQQTSLKGQAPKLTPNIKVRADYVKIFRSIDFAPEIDQMRKIANLIDIGECADALHLRSGDVIFGEYRYLGDYALKALAYPLAEKIAYDNRLQNRRLIVFGQDQVMCRRIAGICNGIVSSDIECTVGISKTAQAFFDIFLMSRCKKIFQAGSGFPTFASWISGNEIVNPYSSADASDQLCCRHIGNGIDISPLYEAHAAWAALASLRGGITEAQQLDLTRRAVEADPDNGLYRLVLAALLYRASKVEEADAVLATAFAHEGPPTGSILRILRNYEQAPLSLVHYWPDIEKAAETSNQAAKCLMVRSGWTAGKLYR